MPANPFDQLRSALDTLEMAPIPVPMPNSIEDPAAAQERGLREAALAQARGERSHVADWAA